VEGFCGGNAAATHSTQGDLWRGSGPADSPLRSKAGEARWTGYVGGSYATEDMGSHCTGVHGGEASRGGYAGATRPYEGEGSIDVQGRGACAGGFGGFGNVTHPNEAGSGLTGEADEATERKGSYLGTTQGHGQGGAGTQPDVSFLHAAGLPPGGISSGARHGGDSDDGSELSYGSAEGAGVDSLPASSELRKDSAPELGYDHVLDNIGSHFRRGCSPVDEESIRTFSGLDRAGDPARELFGNGNVTSPESPGPGWRGANGVGRVALPLGSAQSAHSGTHSAAGHGWYAGGAGKADTGARHGSGVSTHERPRGAVPLSDGSTTGTPTASPGGSARRRHRAGSSSDLSPQSVGGTGGEPSRPRLGGSGRRKGHRPESVGAAEDDVELAGQKLEKAFQRLAAEGRVRLDTNAADADMDGSRSLYGSKRRRDGAWSDDPCSPSTPSSTDRRGRRASSRASESPAPEAANSKMNERRSGADSWGLPGMDFGQLQRERALTFGTLHADGFGEGSALAPSWTFAQTDGSCHMQPGGLVVPSHNLVSQSHLGVSAVTWHTEGLQGGHDLDDAGSRDGSPCASPRSRAGHRDSKGDGRTGDREHNVDVGHGEGDAVDTHGGMSPRGSLDAGCMSSGHHEEPSSPGLAGHRSSHDAHGAFADGLGSEDADMSMGSSPSQVTVKLKACLARFPPTQREEVLSQLIEIDKQLAAGQSPAAAGISPPGKAKDGMSLLAMMPPPRSFVLTKAHRSKSWGGTGANSGSSSEGSGDDEEGTARHKSKRKGTKGDADESSVADAAPVSPPKAATESPSAPAVPPKVKGAPPPVKGKGKGKGEAKGKGKGPPTKGDSGKAKGKGGKNEKKAAEQAKAKHELAKLKPLGWQKLNHVEEGTLWAIDDLDDIEVSMAAIEQLFAWGASGVVKRSAAAGMEEQREISLTTPQRVMGISIGLHSLRHHSMAKVREAIWGLNEEILTQEATHILLVCDPKTHQPTVLPTKEEIEAAKSYLQSGQPQEVLDDASKFIVAVHDIPFLYDRLLLVSFRMTFASNAQSIQQQLNSVSSALSEVRDSRRFASMMKLILKTGNLLNQGTARGEARGFRLSALSQLQQMKQVEGSTEPGNPSSLTLMDHLIDLIAEQKPDLLLLSQDMPNVPFAMRVELDDVKKNINQLRSDLARISRSSGAAAAAAVATEADAPQQGHVDVFSTSASSFIQQATTDIDSLDAGLEEVIRTYAEVAEYFGEKTQKASDLAPMHEWVGYVQKFLMDFERAVAANVARLEKARRKSRRAPRRTLTAARFSRSTMKMDSMLSDTSAGAQGTARSPTGAFQDTIGGLDGIVA